MYTSTGILTYFDNPYKLIVEVDPEIVRYYRSFIPKSVKLNPQKYAPHISVVREEMPPLIDKWKKHEGKKVVFQYSNNIKRGKIYYWLDAYSQELEDIRVELGLLAHSDITRPPNHHRCFHITIGNTKEP